MNVRQIVMSSNMLRVSWCRVLLTSAACAVAAALVVAPARADDRAEELLARARAELGGEKLAKVTALSVKGEFRRLLGEREMNGDLTIDLAAPDRIKRTEEMGFAGGPSMTRVVALERGELREDMTNRGGGFLRMAPGGQGAPGGREITEEDRQRFREMQKRRLQGELQRYRLLWLLQTDRPVKYVGRAEAEDGSAEVLEIETDGPGPIRLFLDEQTARPLMLTYEGFRPRIRMMRPRAGAREGGASGQGPPPMEPPERVTFEVRLDDYRRVDGILLPHMLTESIDGKPFEEWTIERYRVNPAFDEDAFGK
ncbi:MAG TPA: hypothetical protein VNK41_00530 [Vicinamibacterales bacterium]|nr:hypothetical protein [Vicinamibacterales bacterium]